jgi:mRNA interferase MazF
MKNFTNWFKLKPEIDKSDTSIEFREGEIWWGYVGINIGDEEDGKNDLIERPVLVLKKFSAKLFVGLPLSTKIKSGIFYINLNDGIKDYSVLLSQIKTFSSKRLIRKIGKISRGKIKAVKNSLKTLLGL